MEKTDGYSNTEKCEGAFSLDAAYIELLHEFPEMHGKVAVVENEEDNTKNRENMEAAARDVRIWYLDLDSLLERMFKNNAFAYTANSTVVVVMPKSSSQPQDLINKFIPHSADNFVLPDTLNNSRMWLEFYFNHEIGHILARKTIDGSLIGLSEEQAGECAADAYALIRHYQKYGKNSAFGQYWADLRVLGLVHGTDNDHYTLESLDAVTKMAKAGELENLTPAQSRDLAAKIALDTAHTWDAHKALRTVFTLGRALSISASFDRFGTDQNSYWHMILAIGARTSIPIVQKTLLRYLNAMERLIPSERLNIASLDIVRQAVGENSFDHIRPLRSAWASHADYPRDAADYMPPLRPYR